jgi:hypothetical protein
MASGALKKITTRAKQIYKKGGTWATAIKKAGAEYRSKKKKPAKKRRRVGSLSSGPRPASYSIGKVKRRKKVGSMSTGPRPASYSVGSMSSGGPSGFSIGSVAHHITRAKDALEKQIGAAMTRIFKAKTKLAKRKLNKKLSELKTKYRKLC